MPDLELALMRRSLPALSERCERCDACHRSLLVGERAYEYASGTIRCELCRDRERSAPADMRIVHGPEFGHTLRVIDRRAA
jgi:hypothetical protein